MIEERWIPASSDEPFERLFAAEYRRVVAIARRIVRDSATAEDVAQDAFVAFHRRHPNGIAGAPAWLHVAATRGALNALRSERRRGRRERGGLVALAAGARSESDDPLESALRTETQREVRMALARLRDKYAAVLALRYAGLSYAEVAAALRVRTNQVGTLLVRAEAALKKELAHAAPR